MPALTIRHLDGTKFNVTRMPDGRTLGPFEVPSPYGYPVEGRPGSDLMQDLGWYLEKFLDYPFDPDTYTAERVLDALAAWGGAAFNALFDNRECGAFFDGATGAGHRELTVQVRSNDPAVLAWPWEALSDPTAGCKLGHACRVERRIDAAPDPVAVPVGLPHDRVNILLVTARPYEGDVRFRSISRRLVELIGERDLPARVHLLRPPTLARLREHLQERPGYYHILHFDGHGAYGVRRDGGGPEVTVSPHALQASPQGHLVFEDEDGKPDPIEAQKLSDLLREHAVPTVVLNACQSAMVDAAAQDPFASVAASLLRAGIRNVVAMAYSLYVSGAQQFLPEFYRQLFATGKATEAVRRGRQQMYARPERVSRRGPYPLQDWLVPVAYQQEPFDFDFLGEHGTAKAEDEKRIQLPEEAREQGPYGFIGRDGLLLDLERAMRRRPGGILIHGLGGVGKTTLAQGFVKWLHDTEGLGMGCIWIRFSEDIRTADHMLNRMGAMLGDRFLMLNAEAKVDLLVRVFREHPFVIVWDNFELAAGIEGTGIKASLAEGQFSLLRRFVEGIKGSRTKVIITSRSNESWLGRENRVKVDVGGLDGEERWEFLDRVITDLGLSVDRADKALSDLVDRLGGHPLAMQVVLPMIEDRTPGALLKLYDSSLAGLGAVNDRGAERFFATLRMAEEMLAADLRPLLVPLACHERFVDIDYLESITKAAEQPWDRGRIESFCRALSGMGLLRLRFAEWGVYEMHPALGTYLRARQAAAPKGADDWQRAFVTVMAHLAGEYAAKEAHEQRTVFFLNGANFSRALEMAARSEMHEEEFHLLQALAAYAQNTHNYDPAHILFERLSETPFATKNDEARAGAFHQLGSIAEERRDLDAAEKWYRKSLEIKEKQGNEHGAAITYHQLGSIAEERRDLDAAEKWYRKSLEIKEKQGNEHGAASTYHQLGRIAQERRDLDAAEKWYRKSLEISEKQGNEHGAASTYHQLGRIAEERRDLDAAEKWYRKSLEISEKQGNEHGAASTYHQLGSIAQERRDLDAAEKWYRKSLEIEEKQGNEHGAAITYHQLGLIFRHQGRWLVSGDYSIKAIALFTKTIDSHSAQTAVLGFYRTWKAAPKEVGQELAGLFNRAGLGEWDKARATIEKQLSDQNRE